MERSEWMYEIGLGHPAYINGVNEFIKCVREHMRLTGKRSIICPCVKCHNIIVQSDINKIWEHLLRWGFLKNYSQWVLHGESFPNVGSEVNVSREDNEIISGDENLDVNLDENADINDIPDNENLDINDIPDNENLDNENLDEMINDIPTEFGKDIPEIFKELLNETDMQLYPGCENFTKLDAIFELYKLKAKYNWSNVSFTELLKLLKRILPEKNELPDSTYTTKKILCPLSMEVKRIDACPNDCILFRKEYKDLKKCPKCNASRYKLKDDQTEEDEEIGTRVSAKKLWYLPIIPRLKRLFGNPKDAKLMRWHKEDRRTDHKLRHPADSPDWRNIDREFPDFGKDPRNLRMGLCTDGMNPYGIMSSNRSTWPVLLVLYNLPSWLCMKRRYMMMSLLISGPKQPGNDIDVYLAPLLDDMSKLWKHGVEVFDSYSKENFTLRAMIFCTINDFPAYGNLSGFRNKGEKACPICGDETHSLRLNNCSKTVYMGHRRYLDKNHPYRKNKKDFDGTVEKRSAPIPMTGRQVHAVVESTFKYFPDRNITFGKKFQKSIPEGLWKKKSVFWNLEYWPHLQVRHCLDGMHIIKNISESLVGTLLNTPGKTKDGVKIRKDMIEMGIRHELAPVVGENGKRTYLPPSQCTLTRQEKTRMLECLKSIKVPTGYSSNISRKVQLSDLRLIGMKSHDYHVLLTQLLPVAIRGSLEPHVRKSITKLCFFFNSICSKVIDPYKLDKLQRDVILTLNELEMYFPMSFFDIMIHLTVHLVREIRMCGPMYLRYMYPFERAMGQLKGLVRSRCKPEGSIVEGYVAEEVLDFFTDFKDVVNPIGLPKSRYEGRLAGHGTLGRKIIHVDYDQRECAHLKVLQNSVEVAPYVEDHLIMLKEQNPGKTDNWIQKKHNKEFTSWFKQRVETESQSSQTINETARWLSYGPTVEVQTWQGYESNGFTWYTKGQDSKSTVQNSGISVLATAPGAEKADTYYGWIEEIWDLNYRKFHTTVFKCAWINIRVGMRTDTDGITSVRFDKLGSLDDPFVLADKQTMQVFYITDPSDKNWHVVLPSKRRIVGVEDVVDEEEYDQFDDQPLFSTGIMPLPETHNQQHLRANQEGVWVPMPAT